MYLSENELLELANSEGFTAANISTALIPVDPQFRKFCEDNLCGKYNANYACPPACGTVKELQQKLLSREHALILTATFAISGYEDKEAISKAKTSHNAAVLRLLKKLRTKGYDCFASGYNGCPLCSPCKQTQNLPCPHPEDRITCMSAYCIDVAKLARLCNMDFSWDPKKLHLFGMIVY